MIAKNKSTKYQKNVLHLNVPFFSFYKKKSMIGQENGNIYYYYKIATFGSFF